ncbi:DUF1929 domain-containing protein [Micromonospora sp. WMMD1102]|uniref:galactose oxidase-like domain-containing protein n=1 Tax=Micromonospora sp. WMMD1102 TaxID=3016105 RepID=UPI0024151FE7|nr:galactose oxidase-like domain-containing protein [Micromonospora sp. WMMD1102]MDG4788220.1 DUF1929 domain-containing protein [Micromonospora sp. WMMD1102]
MNIDSGRPARRVLGQLLVLVLLVVVGLVGTPAGAAVNLLHNPSLEQLTAGFPSCWEASGWGDQEFSYTVSSDAHHGANAMRIGITSSTGPGDRKLMMLETSTCAPQVTPEHQYDLSAWYRSSTPAVAVTVFRHDTTLGWQYWLDLATLPVAGGWTETVVRTPPVPAGTDQLSWGLSIYGVGWLLTDDYSMVDATVGGPGETCTDPEACEKGAWQVMPYASPVRAIHSVVLHNGRVLLIAGSGNDPDHFAAGSFGTALYDPATGAFDSVPTPADLFCAGHVQLADGRVLVMGGNKDYPSAGGTVGYKGLPDSYLFDPATGSYTRTNDLAAGHWYPSATLLGNGDVLSLGGLGEDANGTVAAEYYDAEQERWLRIWEANQTWSFWGLYPAMVLMQDGRLFYTGSHVFGNGLPGTGASIFDYRTGAITDVPGLRRKDERDQSASVLLPPAQDQRVATFGGGNIETNPDAHRLTDIVDLKQTDPAYLPGPDLPAGTLTGGVPQTATQGKMYVSAVLLPDGTVFETGGALHNRADPVHEASVFDPQTDTFTPMAADPVPRGYHSAAFLLPDGRVMAVGDNPGNGSFDMRISIYSPTYLFKGPRPQITSVARTDWGYGSTQQVTVDSPVTRASLIRPAAVTHSSDPNQRFVELPMSVEGNMIGLNVTSNPNIAPPGWYMLFVHNAAGVPSLASWVRLG